RKKLVGPSLRSFWSVHLHRLPGAHCGVRGHSGSGKKLSRIRDGLLCLRDHLIRFFWQHRSVLRDPKASLFEMAACLRHLLPASTKNLNSVPGSWPREKEAERKRHASGGDGHPPLHVGWSYPGTNF